jgi:hypothetical protein
VPLPTTETTLLPIRLLVTVLDISLHVAPPSLLTKMPLRKPPRLSIPPGTPTAPFEVTPNPA